MKINKKLFVSFCLFVIVLVIVGAVFFAFFYKNGTFDTVIKYDRESAEQHSVLPEYSISIVLSDDKGSPLNEKSVLKQDDNGALKCKITLDYDSTMPRNVGIMYVIDGIPQQFSMNNSTQSYCHELQLPCNDKYEISCIPSGVDYSKNAKVSIVILGNLDPSINYLGDRAEFEEIVLKCNANIGTIETKKSVDNTVQSLSIISVLKTLGIPSESEIKKSEQQGKKLDLEEYENDVNKYYENISNITHPITVINTVDTAGFLSQESVVTLDYTDSNTSQIYIEATGKTGESYMTTVFVDNKPCGAFNGKDTLCWSVEDDEYIRSMLNIHIDEEYAQKQIFAITVDKNGNCFFTPNLLLVNSTSRIDMNVMEISTRTKVYNENGEDLGLKEFETYQGSDLKYNVSVECKTPFKLPLSMFVLVDGSPIKMVVDGTEKIVHNFDIFESNTTHTFPILISKDKLPDSDFIITIGIVERYTGEWYNPFLVASNFDYMSQNIRYISSKYDSEQEIEHNYDSDLNLHNENSINRGQYAGFWSVSQNCTDTTAFFDVENNKDAMFFYHGKGEGDEVEFRSFVFFNDELLQFNTGEKVHTWSCTDGETHMIEVTVPSYKLKNINTIRLVTTKYVDGACIEEFCVFAVVRTHGVSLQASDSAQVYLGNNDALIEIDSENYYLSKCVTKTNINSKAFWRISGSDKERLLFFDELFRTGYIIIDGELVDCYCYVANPSREGIQLHYYNFSNSKIIK